MSIYQEFITALESEELVEVCNTLRNEILLFPNIEIKKKFNIPFFYGKTWICYLNLVKKREIELAFVRGRELASKELLDFKNRDMVGGISYKQVADIDFGELKLLLEEAVTLDQEKPYTFTKRKKK